MINNKMLQTAILLLALSGFSAQSAGFKPWSVAEGYSYVSSGQERRLKELGLWLDIWNTEDRTSLKDEVCSFDDISDPIWYGENFHEVCRIFDEICGIKSAYNLLNDGTCLPVIYSARLIMKRFGGSDPWFLPQLCHDNHPKQRQRYKEKRPEPTEGVYVTTKIPFLEEDIILLYQNDFCTAMEYDPSGISYSASPYFPKSK